MIKFSAFADEVTPDFAGQVAFLAAQNMGYIEIRFVNGKNILDLNRAELIAARNMLEDHGIGVSAIGSPIGKVKLNESFDAHLDRFKHARELADFFQTPFIRIFSYYAPDGKDIDDYRDEVMRRMKAKAELLKGSDIVLVHENEAHIFGHNASNCLDLAQTIDSENFKLAYDPANFVWGDHIARNVEICWPLLKPYVVHVHIKDWKMGSLDIGSMPGAGDGQIKELLRELADSNYNGFLTMEPHLQAGRQFGGETGPELFGQAIQTTRKLCEEVGLAYV
jgi:sugar phosphate isomerase/epimerase